MEIDPLARVEQLERKVAELGSELDNLRARVARVDRVDAADADTARATWAPPVSEQPSQLPAWPSPEVVGRPSSSRNPVVDTETVLKWGGVALVVLAVGFAVSTAISRNWIGPELQLVGALAVGFGLIGSGLRLRPTRPGWTHALCSGGTLALFTTVASDLFVDEANADIAFIATVLIAAGGAVLARTIRSEWVAVATLAGGTIGWGVIGRSDPPFVTTIVWFTLLIAVLIALAVERRWFALCLASHLSGMIALLALIDGVSTTTDRTLLAVATALLAASLCSVPSVGDLTSVWQQLDVQLAALTAPWVFTVTVAGVLDTERDTVIGWTAISIAAGAAAIAMLLRRRIRAAHFVSLVLGASITASIGLAVLMSTTATFLALAVQGAGLVVLGRALDRSVRVLLNAAALTAISSVFVIARMIDAWSDDVPLADDVGNALIIVAIGFAGWQSGERTIRRAGAVAVLGLTLLWLGSVLVHLPQGQAVVSISWAAIGTAAFVAGAVRRDSEVGLVGLAVLGLTVAKLLTVDLREVDALWRAGLFFLVGIGLMRLGFMLPRLDREGDAADPADATDTAEV